VKTGQRRAVAIAETFYIFGPHLSLNDALEIIPLFRSDSHFIIVYFRRNTQQKAAGTSLQPTPKDMNETMLGAVLAGNSTVELQDFPIPEPGHGQVLMKTKSSTICGSDIRAIYREHLGRGPERYQNKIAGHEPCGQIVAEGPGLKRFKKGDRVIVYHISGCGMCNDCRRGYMISCASPFRAAYGWQRDGGMASYILAEEKDLVALPDELSYTDGAQVACGFGTVYEGLEKIGVSGNDAILVMGLGPVGLAALMLARSMGANKRIGVDVVEERLEVARRSWG
jgi:threonine dehydrogenase-like Zn-dependent dehydrogenase